MTRWLALCVKRVWQLAPTSADVTGTVSLPEGTEMVMPGDNATLHIELIAPVALTEGLRFALREGGKTVGAGVVSKITG